MIARRDPLADPAPLIHAVYGFVAYRLGAGPDAEDVTSAVFERALRYRDSYRPARGTPTAWLIGIARTCIAEHLAGRRPPAPPIDEPLADDDLAERAAQRMTLTDAVARLPERDRELIALRFGADLTARQIGRLTGLRTNAVEVALHRALGRLRADLDAHAPELPSPLLVVRV